MSSSDAVITRNSPTRKSGKRLADALSRVVGEANRGETQNVLLFCAFAYELLGSVEIEDLIRPHAESVQNMVRSTTRHADADLPFSDLALRDAFLRVDTWKSGWQDEMKRALEAYEVATS